MFEGKQVDSDTTAKETHQLQGNSDDTSPQNGLYFQRDFTKWQTAKP